MSNSNKRKSAIERYEKLIDALKVSVKIDHKEIFKVVVIDLISKRNFAKEDVKPHFDEILKRYYLGDEDFEKYVINQEPIQF